MPSTSVPIRLPSIRLPPAVFREIPSRSKRLITSPVTVLLPALIVRPSTSAPAFGPEVFNHSGTLNLKFLRPVKDGDSITVHGSVSHLEQGEKGTPVRVVVICENQNQDKTAVGAATAIVP